MLGLEDARDKYRKNRTKIKWAQRALKLAGDVSHNPKVIAAFRPFQEIRNLFRRQLLLKTVSCTEQLFQSLLLQQTNSP